MLLLIPALALTLGATTQAAPVLAQETKPEPPAFSTRRLAATKLIDESGAEVSVAYRTLDGAEEWLHEADKVFHAASTMKVALMVGA